MKPGPIERTNRDLDEQLEHKVKRVPKRLELEVMLRHTAADLLTAAWILQRRYETFAATHEPQLAAPPWSEFAAQAFDAIDLLGIVNLDRFPAAQQLRPWTGAL
jgi:hypothetical protein